MSGRKYKSRAEKRKIQLNREKERCKCAKLSNFFVLYRLLEVSVAILQEDSDKQAEEALENAELLAKYVDVGLWHKR